MDSPPKILRIKRKRGQDPLQALILEDRRSAKRSKSSTPINSRVPSPVLAPQPDEKSFYFTLSRTDAQIDDLQSLLSEAPANVSRKRKFIIPKNQTEEDAVIPNELADMVNLFLTVGESTKRRKKRSRTGAGTGDIEAEEEKQPEIEEEPADITAEYVYDVYLLSNTEPLTTANHPQSQIGYIRFFDDADNDLYQSDDDDASKPVFSDDEDSNAEDFYQNDYPEDEDAGGNSDFSLEEVDGSVVIPQDDIERDNYIGSLRIEEYSAYDEVDFRNIVDHDDDDEDVEEEGFARQNFFPGDEEDEMAIHRDRIFGRLERMIQERD